MKPGKAPPSVEARGQGPASPGRPLTRPAQPLLPFAPARLPRSQRWAGGQALDDGDTTPARLALAPAQGRASPSQSPSGSRLSRCALRARRLSPPSLGVPGSCARLGSRLGTREEGGSRGAASSDPETPYKEEEGSPGRNKPYLVSTLYGATLYGPATSGSGRREEGGGKGRGQRRELPGSLCLGVPSYGLRLKLSPDLGVQGARAGARPGVRNGVAHRSRIGGFTSLRVLPAGLAILGLPASHIWPCTSRRRRAGVVTDPSNRSGSAEPREIPARRT